jgi:hypothetical protein
MWGFKSPLAHALRVVELAADVQISETRVGQGFDGAGCRCPAAGRNGVVRRRPVTGA